MSIKDDIITSESPSVITSITPWLPVYNGWKAVEFYKSAFGAVEIYRMETPEGELVVNFLVDGAGFWISGGSSENKIEENNPENEYKARIILTVSDPDTVFQNALLAGASEVFPVGEEYGWRLGRLIDPFGYHWEIGHPLKG